MHWTEELCFNSEACQADSHLEAVIQENIVACKVEQTRAVVSVSDTAWCQSTSCRNRKEGTGIPEPHSDFNLYSFIYTAPRWASRVFSPYNTEKSFGFPAANPSHKHSLVQWSLDVIAYNCISRTKSCLHLTCVLLKHDDHILINSSGYEWYQRM